MLALFRSLLAIGATALGSCGGIAPEHGYSGSGPVPRGTGACLDLARQAEITVSGVLSMRVFAGPPNYQSLADGDAEERALILELPDPLCADDGEFIGAGTSFDRIHVSSHSSAVLDALNAAVGGPVTVRGKAFGAHTGHHRAPLVLFADEVVVR